MVLNSNLGVEARLKAIGECDSSWNALCNAGTSGGSAAKAASPEEILVWGGRKWRLEDHVPNRVATDLSIRTAEPWSPLPGIP